jgi:Circularly permutated YpsA SLOG family
VLDRVVSGGQTGADQAGWRAARASAIDTGGWMPENFLTEAGPRPDFFEMFGAVELPGGGRLSGPVPAPGSRSTW